MTIRGTDVEMAGIECRRRWSKREEEEEDIYQKRGRVRRGERENGSGQVEMYNQWLPWEPHTEGRRLWVWWRVKGGDGGGGGGGKRAYLCREIQKMGKGHLSQFMAGSTSTHHTKIELRERERGFLKNMERRGMKIKRTTIQVVGYADVVDRWEPVFISSIATGGNQLTIPQKAPTFISR